MIYRICAIMILICFYSIYIGKMLIQKKKGIHTDQIAKGKKSNNIFIIELLMKIATYAIVFIEIISIIGDWSLLTEGAKFDGILLGIIGNVIFAVAVVTMKDSWRAGIPVDEKTSIITKGIYGYSRNPAFLGFDFVYIGILLMYFNIVLLIFTIYAIVMLHLQILQEEKFLAKVFGQAYIEYKSKVMRYLGRKN